MKNLKSIVGSTMLVVALSAPALAKTGVISTTKTGVISTTRTGTTATARSNSTDSFDQSWLLQLLFTFFNPW